MVAEDEQITPADVSAALKSAPSKKSAGPDGITSLHLKNLGEKAISYLAKLFTTFDCFFNGMYGFRVDAEQI